MKNITIGLLIIGLLALPFVLGCGKIANEALPETCAADDSSGCLVVEVKDEVTGFGLQDVNVSLGETRQITDADGRATFEKVEAACLDYSVSKEGYSACEGRIEVAADAVTTKDILIRPEVFFYREISPYALSDKSAIIIYKTSVEIAKGKVFFGTDPSLLDNLGANFETGFTSCATLLGLEPGTVYYYKIVAEDSSGNALESGVGSFCLPRSNLALGKAVTGTFTYFPPNDPLVSREKDVLSRVTDGVTGYFEGMATSGPVAEEDQQVTIDLGAAYPICSILTYWRSLAYPRSFCVRVSKDNLNWIEVSSGLNAEAGAFSRSDAGDPMRVLNTKAEGISARYVQVLIKKNSPIYVKHFDWDFVQLMELQVFSD